MMINYGNADFNPHNIPLPATDFFSFFDNEIYYIGALENGECSRFISIKEEVLSYDSVNKTKFLFRWKGTGYVICDADNPSVVLTLKFSNETGNYFISAERYQNRAEQIWEILPHLTPDKKISGLSVRSAVKSAGSAVYIGWTGDEITAFKSTAETTVLALEPLSDWITFGMACMQYLEWNFSTENDVTRALKNYYGNVRANISPENAVLYGNTGLIINQNGGNFKNLSFADVFMNDVACEIIAVCNAVRMITNDFDETNEDFFRLALEFELSGMYKNSFKKFVVNAGTALGIRRLSSISTKDGGWGSDPDRIGSCLEAHNIKYKKVHIKDQTSSSKQSKAQDALKKADELIMQSRCGIISYNFSTLFQAIHTFACAYEGNKVQTFNRNCSHTPDIITNFSIPDSERGAYATLTDAFINDRDARYYVGYFLYE